MLDTAKKVLQEEFPQFSHITRLACTESRSRHMDMRQV